VKPAAENGPKSCSSEAAGPFIMLPTAAVALSSVPAKGSYRDTGMTALDLLRMMQQYEFVRQAVENSLPQRMH
jgi:hypothetical protein